MKESLAAARNIHQILIIICTIVSVFSLSLKKEKNDFEKTLVMVENIESAVDQLLDKPLNSRFKVNDINLVIDSTKLEYLKNVKSHYSVSKILSSLRTGHMSRNPADAGPNLLRDFMELGHPLSSSSLYTESNNPTLESITRKTLANAKPSLEQESARFNQQLRNDVDVSGLKVAGDSIYIIGPFITLVLLIYLTTLLRHIYRISSNNDTDVGEFPWLVLFPDIPSQILTSFTIYFYPIVSIWLIIFRSNISNGESWKWFILFSSGHALISLYLIGKIQSLHYKIYADSNTKSLSDVLR